MVVSNQVGGEKKRTTKKRRFERTHESGSSEAHTVQCSPMPRGAGAHAIPPCEQATKNMLSGVGEQGGGEGTRRAVAMGAGADSEAKGRAAETPHGRACDSPTPPPPCPRPRPSGCEHGAPATQHTRQKANRSGGPWGHRGPWGKPHPPRRSQKTDLPAPHGTNC